MIIYNHAIDSVLISLLSAASSILPAIANQIRVNLTGVQYRL